MSNIIYSVGMIPNKTDLSNDRQYLISEVLKSSFEYMSKYRLNDYEHSYKILSENDVKVVDDFVLKNKIELEDLNGNIIEYNKGTWILKMEVSDKILDNIRKGNITGLSISALDDGSKEEFNKVFMDKVVSKSKMLNDFDINDFFVPIVSFTANPCMEDCKILNNFDEGVVRKNSYNSIERLSEQINIMKGKFNNMVESLNEKVSRILDVSLKEKVSKKQYSIYSNGTTELLSKGVEKSMDKNEVFGIIDEIKAVFNQIDKAEDLLDRLSDTLKLDTDTDTESVDESERGKSEEEIAREREENQKLINNANKSGENSANGNEEEVTNEDEYNKEYEDLLAKYEELQKNVEDLKKSASIKGYRPEYGQTQLEGNRGRGKFERADGKIFSWEK